MKIKLLRNIGIGGKFHSTGEVVEVSRQLGLELIGGKRGEPVDVKDEPVSGGVISTENGLEPFPAEEDDEEPAKPTKPAKPGRGK